MSAGERCPPRQRRLTLDRPHSTVADATGINTIPDPWVKTHGYHHALAPRGKRADGSARVRFTNPRSSRDAAPLVFGVYRVLVIWILEFYFTARCHMEFHTSCLMVVPSAALMFAEIFICITG